MEKYVDMKKSDIKSDEEREEEFISAINEETIKQEVIALFVLTGHI